MKRSTLSWLLLSISLFTVVACLQSAGDARAGDESQPVDAVSLRDKPTHQLTAEDWATMPIEQVMARKRDRFIVLDNIGSRGKPSLWPIRMPRLRRLGPGEILGKADSEDLPPRHRVQSLANLVHRQGNASNMVCLNIEHWRLRGSGVTKEMREANAVKLATLADWMHQSAPGMRLGYYRMIPARDYFAVVRNHEDNIERWKKHNDWLSEELGPHVDVLFPSLYTYEPNKDLWRTYAQANIAEAKRMKKQVYPFLWPHFDHNARPESLADTEIPREMWRLQLETCLRHADGLVIWTGSTDPWDPQDEWWQETVDFLAELYDEPEIRQFRAEPKRQ